MHSLKQGISFSLTERCRGIGFVKKSNWYIRNSCNVGYKDLLSFSFYNYKSSLALSCFSGICNSQVDELYKTMTGNRTNAPIPLICINLGYIEPYGRFKDWLVQENNNYKIIEENIFREIQEYTTPFYKEYSDVERLLLSFEKMELNIDKEQQFFMLPLLYLITGQKQRGIAFMNNLLSSRFVLDDYKKNYMSNYFSYGEK